MNKQQLIDALAEKLSVGKNEAEKAIEGVVEVITEALRSGQEVAISGFGLFEVKARNARMGVNPRNPAERIEIPAVKVPKFRAGKNLKDAVR